MVIILPIGAVFLKVGTVFTARKEETCSPLLHRLGEMASKYVPDQLLPRSIVKLIYFLVTAPGMRRHKMEKVFFEVSEGNSERKQQEDQWA